MNKKPKRRRFSFSLRTCMVIITLLGIAFGWCFSQAERQRRSIASIRADGKHVRIRYEYYNGNEGLPPGGFIRPPTPPWATMLGLDDFFLTATSLDCHDLKDLSNLAELSGLRELSLSKCEQTDLSALTNLKNLTHLTLDGGLATDLTPLYGMPNLKSLIVLNANITKQELERLQKAMPDVYVYVR